VSATAVDLGRQRAAAQGVASQARFEQADLDETLPLAAASFDAALALDVVIHLRDRAALFREVRRVLAPGGRFLFTDAGVLTGTVSDAERAARSPRGRTRLVPAGFDEDALAAAGLSLLETEDRTGALAQAAERRRAAREANRPALEEDEGAQAFAREQQYLRVVVDLARRHALSRFMYLAEARER
jgi:SAM-dependent methyltransferase